MAFLPGYVWNVLVLLGRHAEQMVHECLPGQVAEAFLRIKEQSAGLLPTHPRG
jgi:hypothetical protein